MPKPPKPKPERIEALLEQLLQSDFHDVYSKPPTKTEAGRTLLRQYTEKAGVYIISERRKGARTEELVYAGMASHDLYKTISRHFQNWKDADQPDRITYRKKIIAGTHYKISVGICPAEVARMLERALVLTYGPRDNKDKMETFEHQDEDETFYKYIAKLKKIFGRRRSTLIRMLTNPDTVKTYSGKINWKRIEAARKIVRELEEQLRKLG